MRMNAAVAGIIKYGDEVLDWTRKQLKSIDIKTRKLVTVKGVCIWKVMLLDCILQEKKEEEGL